jgi:hypothetical protein
MKMKKFEGSGHSCCQATRASQATRAVAHKHVPQTYCYSRSAFIDRLLLSIYMYTCVCVCVFVCLCVCIQRVSGNVSPSDFDFLSLCKFCTEGTTFDSKQVTEVTERPKPMAAIV